MPAHNTMYFQFYCLLTYISILDIQLNKLILENIEKAPENSACTCVLTNIHCTNKNVFCCVLQRCRGIETCLLGIYNLVSQLLQNLNSGHICVNFHLSVAITCNLSWKTTPLPTKNVVSQGRWCVVTSSVTLKYRTFCQEYLVFQDRWSLIAVICQGRFHCNIYYYYVAVDPWNKTMHL